MPYSLTDTLLYFFIVQFLRLADGNDSLLGTGAPLH